MKNIFLKLFPLLTVFLFVVSVYSNASAACTYDPSTYSAVCTGGGQNTYLGNSQPQVTQSVGQYPDLCAVLNRTMGVYTKGADVRRLQVVLGQEGIAYLNVTGTMNKATQNAIKVFQQRNGITRTGFVGPRTLAAMQSLWCSGSNGNNYSGGGTSINNYINNNGQLSATLVPSSSSGYNVTLTWTSTGANSCNLNGQNVPPNGSQVVNVPTQTNFTLTCNGYSGGSISKTISVKPNQDFTNLPTVNAYINPSSALINTTATIYWTSQNTQSCSVNNGQVPLPLQQFYNSSGVTVTSANLYNGYNNYTNGNLPTSGSQQIYVTSSAANYTVSCTGLNGQVVSATVSTGGAPLPPVPQGVGTAYIYASTQNIVTAGQPTTLTWTSANTNSCIVTGGGQNFSGINGTQIVYPTTTTTYQLNCAATNGQNVSYQVTVNVSGTGTGTVTANLLGQTGQDYVGQTTTTPDGVQDVHIQLTNIASTISAVTITGNAGGTWVYPTNNTNWVIGEYPQANNLVDLYFNPLTTVNNTSYTLNITYINGTTATAVTNATSVTNGTISLVSNSNGLVNIQFVAPANNNNGTFPQISQIAWGDGQSQASTGWGTTLSHQYNSSGTYNIILYDSFNNQTGSLTVNVTTNGTNSGNITETIFSNPQNISSGQSTTLTAQIYSPNYAVNSCTINGGAYSGTNFPITLTSGPQYSYTGTMNVSPTTSTTYSINCTNSQGQTGSQSVYVTVSGTNTGNITANIYANVSNTTYASQPVVLTWSSTNATYCNISGGSTNLTSQSTSGSTTVYPTVSTSYIATCYNSSGQNVASSPTYVTVNGGNGGNVTATLSANYSTVASGQPVTLTWTSTNANYCSITGNNSNLVSSQSPNGSYVVYPSVGTNYIITCTNSTTGQYGTNFVYVSINNSNTSTTPTVTVTSNLTNVTSGQQVQLTWYSSNANYCNILSNGNTLAGQQSTGGTYIVVPTQTTTYQVTCYNTTNGLSGSNYATVNVNGNGSGNVTLSLATQSGNTVTVFVPQTGGTIYWGDGQNSQVQTTNTFSCVGNASSCISNLSHTYTSAGSYQISYNGSYLTVNVSGGSPTLTLQSNQNRYVTVLVNNSSCSSNNTYIAWGDGQTSYLSSQCGNQTLSHQYSYSGNMIVNLYVSGSTVSTLNVYIQ